MNHPFTRPPEQPPRGPVNAPWAQGGVPLPLSEWIKLGRIQIGTAYSRCDDNLAFIGLKTRDELRALYKECRSIAEHGSVEIIEAAEGAYREVDRLRGFAAGE